MTAQGGGKILAAKKDLHNGRSLWFDSPRRTVKTRRLSRDLTCEIAVVGGGISGALSALTLSAAGHEVVVVDRRAPGTGSTLASTAMIQFELDTPLMELSDKIGSQKATRAYRRSLKAVKDLATLFKSHNIDSCWQDRQALYLAGDAMGSRALRQEADARARIGLPSHYLNKAALSQRFGIERTGAILSDGSAELDPARASASCLRAAQKFGAVVLAPCNIATVEALKGGVILTTDKGCTITAKKVIFATGYEVIKGLPREAFEIISSWAIATQSLPANALWPERCLLWEASDPYLYARTSIDNRIIVGGEDSGLNDPQRRLDAIPAKAAVLLRKIRALLGKPDLEIDYAWAGAFADSPTGLPIIKDVPGLPGAMAILGCGGNGITFSMIAAQIAQQWAAGKKDPDWDLFQGIMP